MKHKLHDARRMNFLLSAESIEQLDRLHDTSGASYSELVRRAIAHFAATVTAHHEVVFPARGVSTSRASDA